MYSNVADHRVGIDNRANSLSGIIFSPDKVKWAVSFFKPFKAPGGDGLFPALLQKVIALIMPGIIAISRASYNWGYIPTTWRQVNVIFIPKPGNRPSELSKSYRPISLTSFVLKTMERLIDVDIRGRLDCLITNKHIFIYMYV